MTRLGTRLRWAAAAAVAAGAALGVGAWLRSSPGPSITLIRRVFDRGGRRTARAALAYVPADVTTIRDLRYDHGDPDALLDVHHLAGLLDGEARTTVVWVHGGAWVSGDKNQVANHLRVLAGHGFTVVGLDYSIAPRALYPTPVRQVLDALAYLTQHATELHVDPSRLVLAGDSAGAQIAAQVAGVVTSPAYAERVGLTPRVDASQLVGTALFCGAYDLELTRGLTGSSRWFVHSVLRAFTGATDFVDDPRFAGISVIRHLTTDFPPTFVSAGNADPLLPHSLALASALTAAGVPHETLFFDADHTPLLGHEYQFRLDTDDGQLALRTLRQFLADLPGRG
ncbi:alpha/beta hydrolase [Cellulomonas hominis]